MIRISDLTVKFGGVVALDSVSVELEENVVGVIGPNGAGKTTLINVLSGFVVPYSGAIEVEGMDILSLLPHRRARWGLARSFQKVQTALNLTVEDNIQVVLDNMPHSRTEKAEMISNVLAYLDIEDVSGTVGLRLNPYQRRMTEIARCLAASPRIVLLDEPGGGMSEAEVKMLKSVISGIHETFGAQVLLIDHDVDLIKAVCSKTMVLDFGKLIAYDRTAKVLQDENVKAAYLGTEASV
ncbi:MAG: ATP-binding cassette domain-containing protein [Sneathiella sp.]